MVAAAPRLGEPVLPGPRGLPGAAGPARRIHPRDATPAVARRAPRSRCVENGSTPPPPSGSTPGLGYAARLLPRGAPADRELAPWFGIAAGACWAAEIWVGGPARLGHVAGKATGATLALAATGFTLAAGIVIAIRVRRAGPVWRVGLLTGTISGSLVYAFAVLMTMASLGTLGLRSDHQAQFASRHLPTMPDFLVNAILTSQDGPAGKHSRVGE